MMAFGLLLVEAFFVFYVQKLIISAPHHRPNFGPVGDSNNIL